MSYQDNCLSGVVGSFDENWERERIEFDGATYKVGDKSYILMDLLETDKT